MNQILEVKRKNNKIVKFFKVQLFISFIFLIIIIIYILYENYENSKNRAISNTININAKLLSVFNENNSNKEIYFGKIKISKINLEYYIYNQYSDEALKILPCKFAGKSLRSNGNICIIGHNYFDDRFFSNLYKLRINDEIIVEDLNSNKYKYTIYRIYEINENEISEAVKGEENKKTLTLCTCTLEKNKRLIIKANNI